MNRELKLHGAMLDPAGLSTCEKRRGISILAAKQAKATMQRYETGDVFEICNRAGVQLAYQRWPLVTIGECEPRFITIRVNLAALECVERAPAGITRALFERNIIAHELAHLLVYCGDAIAGGRETATNDYEWNPGEHLRNLDGVDARAFEEHFANRFAAALLNLSAREEERIGLAAQSCRLRVALDIRELGPVRAQERLRGDTTQENSRGHA